MSQVTPSRAHRRSSAVCVLALAALMMACPRAAPALDDAGLLAALRAGGVNLYFRHAQTNWSLYDDVRVDEDIESCDPQRMRQLSDEGRAVAARVGAAIRALGIPIGRVLASPYCRTRETAELMRLGPVATTTDVMNMRVADRFGGRGAIVDSARTLLATPPAEGTNTVIVAHGNVARDATPVYPGEAEGVAFRPDGRGGFEVLGRIPPERWEALGEAQR